VESVDVEEEGKVWRAWILRKTERCGECGF
jgi:hypothetical protein